MVRTLIALLVATLSQATAQTPPAFDVAVIKLTVPPPGVSSMSRYGEYIGSLQSLIKTAYGLEDYRISGGPKWLDGDIYSVVYKPVGPQASIMLRALLIERFKLAMHTETRQLTVYALTVAKSGPKMEAIDIPVSTSAGPGMVKGEMDMTQLSSSLSAILGRRVIDRTGFTGHYKLSLKWTPDNAPASGDNSGVSLFTAIQLHCNPGTTRPQTRFHQRPGRSLRSRPRRKAHRKLIGLQSTALSFVSCCRNSAVS